MSDAVPPNVRALLEDRIDSFEKLQLVMALRDASESVMTLDELVGALPYSRDTLREIVAELTGANLVERTPRGAVKLVVSQPEQRAELEQLAELWTRDRVVVARTLSEIAVSRIRNMAEQAFTPKPRGGKR